MEVKGENYVLRITSKVGESGVTWDRGYLGQGLLGTAGF